MCDIACFYFSLFIVTLQIVNGNFQVMSASSTRVQLCITVSMYEAGADINGET